MKPFRAILVLGLHVPPPKPRRQMVDHLWLGRWYGQGVSTFHRIALSRLLCGPAGTIKEFHLILEFACATCCARQLRLLRRVTRLAPCLKPFWRVRAPDPTPVPQSSVLSQSCESLYQSSVVTWSSYDLAGFEKSTSHWYVYQTSTHMHIYYAHAI